MTVNRMDDCASRRRFLAYGGTAFSSIAFVMSPAKAAQFEFKCASSLAADHPSSIRLTQMFAAIEQESAGRVHVQLFPNSELGGDSSMLTQLRQGAIQLFSSSPGNLSSVVPVADIASIGLAFKDQDEVVRVLEGPLGTYVRQEAMARGMYAMRGPWTSGMYQVGATLRPVRVVNDLRGFKIRVVQSRIMIDLFQTLGASPSTISFNDVYTGLQTKLIDGESVPLVTLETSRLYEVNKYVSLTNHAWAGAWLLVNGDVWKGLPTDLQVIVERNNSKFVALERQDVKAGDAAVAARLAGRGVTLNQVDQTPFRNALRSYYQNLAGTFGSTVWGLLETGLGRKLT